MYTKVLEASCGSLELQDESSVYPEVPAASRGYLEV